MAGHQHIWQRIAMQDSVAKACLWGSYRVEFKAEHDRPVDIYSDAILDLLEAEGTAEVKDVPSV